MGTYTTNYNLYMPTVGEQGWGTLVNGNFSTIDTTMKGLDTRIRTLEPLSVIHVDENQNVTFPAGVKINISEYAYTGDIELYEVVCNDASLPETFSFDRDTMVCDANPTVRYKNTTLFNYIGSTVINTQCKITISYRNSNSSTNYTMPCQIIVTNVNDGSTVLSETFTVVINKSSTNTADFTFARNTNNTYNIELIETHNSVYTYIGVSAITSTEVGIGYLI